MKHPTSDRVEYLLKNYPETRNSDKELIVKFLEHLKIGLTPSQIEILQSVNFESIRRTRQKFQEKGLYVATDPVRMERRHKALEVQQVAPGASPAFIASKIEKNGQTRLI